MQLQITYMKIMWNNYAQTTRYNDECSNICCFSIGLYIIYTDEALFFHVLVLLILIVCMIYIMCILTLKISWGLSTSHWAMQCLM